MTTPTIAVPDDPYAIVTPTALLPGLRTPSPSDLVRVLQRIAAEGMTLTEACAAERVRRRHVLRIARNDPDVFERHLAAALAQNGRHSSRRRERSDERGLAA